MSGRLPAHWLRRDSILAAAPSDARLVRTICEYWPRSARARLSLLGPGCALLSLLAASAATLACCGEAPLLVCCVLDINLGQLIL